MRRHWIDSFRAASTSVSVDSAGRTPHILVIAATEGLTSVAPARYFCRARLSFSDSAPTFDPRMAVFDPDNLHLTDFMDLATLQEIQDSFAAVAEVKATITDAQGNVLTQPTPTRAFLRRQRVLAETAANGGEDGVGAGSNPGPTAPPPAARQDQPQRDGAEYVAPIIVNDQRLGTIRMAANGTAVNIDEAKLISLGEK